MSQVAANLSHVRASLPQGVTLVAVSKFHPADDILEAYSAGQRDFGESRANELVAKAGALPPDIRWHFIGHLQTNKLRLIMPVVSLIQSVDSLRLLELIDREASRLQRRVDVLLQVHVAREETKFGFLPDELIDLARSGAFDHLAATDITGVMGMASNTDDTARIEADFNLIASIFHTLADGPFSSLPRFDTLSMGMSDDRTIAIKAGSNMVRIGSDIFGPRL